MSEWVKGTRTEIMKEVFSFIFDGKQIVFYKFVELYIRDVEKQKKKENL